MAILAIWIEPMLSQIFLRGKLVAWKLALSFKLNESSLTSISNENLSNIKSIVLQVEVEGSNSFDVKLKLKGEREYRRAIACNFELWAIDLCFWSSIRAWYVVLSIIEDIEHIKQLFVLNKPVHLDRVVKEQFPF